MKHTSDDAKLSDASTEVLWTPLEHIGPTRLHRENTRSTEMPKGVLPIHPTRHSRLIHYNWIAYI